MRIGISIGEMHEAGAGGSATYQATILKEILKTKSSHQFYIFYKGQNSYFDDTENVKFIETNQEKRPASGKRKLFRRKPKKILVSTLNEKALNLKIEVMWFPVLNHEFVEMPFILTVWDLQHRLQTYFPEVSLSGWPFELREEFYKKAISTASYVIIGNSEGARQVEKFYNFPVERIRTIPLATPQFVFEQEGDDEIVDKNQLQKKSYLFYPAQFWPHKNHIRVLKALALLKKQNIDLKVVFTGSDKGNEKYIKEKVAEFGLEQDVKFLGFVSQAELVGLYKNAAALVFPSMFGPDNIPPLEAMALKCPVICSNAKGLEEQLGDAALFFNPLDEVDLAEKITLLLRDEVLKNRLVEKGHELASNLTPGQYLKSFLEIIEEFHPIRECWSSSEKYIHP